MTALIVRPAREPNALDQIACVQKFMPQVRYIARRIHDRLPPQVPIADLVQAGIVGLLDAMRRYDGARGVRFESYAAFRIRGAILDSLRDLDWSPRELRHKARLFDDAAARLEQKFGRSASEKELAEAMDLPLDEFRRALTQIRGLDLFELDAPLRAEDGAAGCRDVADTRSEDAFQSCLRGETRHSLAAAIGRLPPKQQQVLALYYYEELTMNDIAKLLGVGESRVSQLHSMALLSLRGKLGRRLGRQSTNR
jgi:RNA polymerase sigma factor for flagellar operon FliA